MAAATVDCRACPGVNFSCYTKEVGLFRRLVMPDPPDNLHCAYSYGGVQDRSLDPGVDRVADVFPDEDAIDRAAWSSQRASDLLAVLGPPLVGMSANRIPAFLKRIAGRRFSTWQVADTAACCTARRIRQAPTNAVMTAAPTGPAGPLWRRTAVLARHGGTARGGRKPVREHLGLRPEIFSSQMACRPPIRTGPGWLGQHALAASAWTAADRPGRHVRTRGVLQLQRERAVESGSRGVMTDARN